jgi:flagellar biosynthetic protein FliQ
MEAGDVINLGGSAIWTAALVASPILLTALAVGLIVGILQAATSIQEMTLSFIPKLIALALALAIFGEWQLATMVEFYESIFERVQYMFLS